MRIHVFPLDFYRDGALLAPTEQSTKLHDMAVAFCAQNLAQPVCLGDFAKVWVAAEVDEKSQPVNILGVTGYVMKPDIPMFRALDRRATLALYDRLDSFFADQGYRGKEVFIYISDKETPEQRCAEWEASLQHVGANPACRYSVVCK